MKETTRFSNYGPGGRKCPCCGPGPSEKVSHDRMVKRRIKQAVKKEIKAEING